MRTPVDREHLGRPLYDTFIPLDTATWRVPVANGTHAVVIMCGDADSREQTNNMVVNGVAIVDSTPYDGLVTFGYETGSFDGYALTVNVSDGFITMQAGAGALQPKINFIEIAPAGSTMDAATSAGVQVAAVKATHDTAKPQAKVPPLVKRYVWGTYVDELVGYTIQKPRHAAKRFYVASNHLYSPSAVTNSAGQVVPRYTYDAYGRQTIRNPAGVAISTTDPAALQRGFTGYRIDSETGLYYARARMYSAKLGRFVSRDPSRKSIFIRDVERPVFDEHEDRIIYTVENRVGNNLKMLEVTSPTVQPGMGYHDGASLYRAYYVPNDLDPSGENNVTIDSSCSCCIKQIRIIPETGTGSFTPTPGSTYDADGVFLLDAPKVVKLIDNCWFTLTCDCKNNVYTVNGGCWPWWLGGITTYPPSLNPFAPGKAPWP